MIHIPLKSEKIMETKTKSRSWLKLGPHFPIVSLSLHKNKTERKHKTILTKGKFPQYDITKNKEDIRF